MNILGISYNYHDAAAALLQNGVPVAAAAEERFSRRKHDARFPAAAIAYCLAAAKLDEAALDAVVFYEKPARKLERVLQIARHYAPHAAAQLAAQFPPLIVQGINAEHEIRERLNYTGEILFCEHHLAHAASAFYVSPYQEAAILTVDGVGEWATCGIYAGAGNSITPLREIHYPHSLGLLYSTLTAYLGFAVNDDEYKVMGLAAYGQARFMREVGALLQQHEDGSFALALQYFSFMHSQTMFSEKLVALLGPPRQPEAPVEARHQDIAASLQAVLEAAMLRLAASARTATGSQNLCLAGGVAYNCAANAKLKQAGLFAHIFIQPAAGDDGAALGAALWASHALHNQSRSYAAHDTLLGPAFTEAEIETTLRASGVSYARYDEAALCAKVAQLIAADMVVGWHQGRMEFGPRALGARSILANPRNPAMQDILNARVKFREPFRPFAPAVLEAAAADYFELDGDSPFMLMTPRVRKGRAEEIPAVTHVDGTARVQTVSPVAQPLFHKLIEAFGALTGTPVLINTSFNIRGEPIICTPADALRCFRGTDIDFLAIGPFLVAKV